MQINIAIQFIFMSLKSFHQDTNALWIHLKFDFK